MSSCWGTFRSSESRQFPSYSSKLHPANEVLFSDPLKSRLNRPLGFSSVRGTGLISAGNLRISIFGKYSAGNLIRIQPFAIRLILCFALSFFKQSNNIYFTWLCISTNSNSNFFIGIIFSHASLFPLHTKFPWSSSKLLRLVTLTQAEQGSLLAVVHSKFYNHRLLRRLLLGPGLRPSSDTFEGINKGYWSWGGHCHDNQTPSL